MLELPQNPPQQPRPPKQITRFFLLVVWTEAILDLSVEVCVPEEHNSSLSFRLNIVRNVLVTKVTSPGVDGEDTNSERRVAPQSGEEALSSEGVCTAYQNIQDHMSTEVVLVLSTTFLALWFSGPKNL